LSAILRLEHVAQQLLHLGIADDLAEEGLLNLVSVANAEVGKEHQESSKPGDVTRRARLDVVAQHGEGLILKVLHLSCVLQTRSFWNFQI